METIYIEQVADGYTVTIGTGLESWWTGFHSLGEAKSFARDIIEKKWRSSRRVFRIRVVRDL